VTKTTLATLADHRAALEEWYVVDASKHTLGRMAVRIATVLMGKHKPLYSPNISVGSGVIVTNAGRVGVTGRKRETREYTRVTGYVGNQKRFTLGEALENDPELLIKLAVRRMLPKNRYGREALRRLKVYRGAEHPHTAQKPQELKIV
jgi:large subunit ribosomal protein L13